MKKIIAIASLVLLTSTGFADNINNDPEDAGFVLNNQSHQVHDHSALNGDRSTIDNDAEDASFVLATATHKTHDHSALEGDRSVIDNNPEDADFIHND